MTSATTLRPIRTWDDVPVQWQGCAIGDLLAYHNLGRALPRYERAELLIGMCMDHRKRLRLPENFAYVLRSGGANLRRMEFKVSYAVAIGGVRAIALIGHDQCGMVGLAARRPEFVEGLVRVGWSRKSAQTHFELHADSFGIDDAGAFVVSEARRLRARYPGVVVAPLLYTVADGRLSLVELASGRDLEVAA